jgi:hypothetical protein
VLFYHSNTAECHWRWIKWGGIGFWGEECKSDTLVHNHDYDLRSKRFSVRFNGKIPALNLRLFDALPSSEIPEPPCGELGMTVDCAGYFMVHKMVHKNFPERVIYVSLGHDGTMIDPGSITLN